NPLFSCSAVFPCRLGKLVLSLCFSLFFGSVQPPRFSSELFDRPVSRSFQKTAIGVAVTATHSCELQFRPVILVARTKK
ncbi:hypothetical protein M5D96_011834, partial [Drosophila gunungcola]